MSGWSRSLPSACGVHLQSVRAWMPCHKCKYHRKYQRSGCESISEYCRFPFLMALENCPWCSKNSFITRPAGQSLSLSGAWTSAVSHIFWLACKIIVFTAVTSSLHFIYRVTESVYSWQKKWFTLPLLTGNKAFTDNVLEPGTRWYPPWILLQCPNKSELLLWYERDKYKNGILFILIPQKKN